MAPPSPPRTQDHPICWLTNPISLSSLHPCPSPPPEPSFRHQLHCHSTRKWWSIWILLPLPAVYAWEAWPAERGAMIPNHIMHSSCQEYLPPPPSPPPHPLKHLLGDLAGATLDILHPLLCSWPLSLDYPSMPSFSSVPPNPIPGVSFTITELEDALSSLQTATRQERMMYSYTS